MNRNLDTSSYQRESMQGKTKQTQREISTKIHGMYFLSRFFTNIGQNRFDNPKAGTIIDDVVTLPERYDFFMVSQSVNQGTVNPTSYNVIYDTSGFKPDIIQQLTYKLTHLYFNWPGTVKVPAPCQYAHKLAYLVGETLHDQPSSALSKYAFYL